MAVYKKVPGHETVNISTLEFDETPTPGSLNPVTSGGVAESVSQQSSNIAPNYTKTTYPANSYVMHDGVLYTNPNAIGTAEDWNPAHWTQTTVAEMMAGAAPKWTHRNVTESASGGQSKIISIQDHEIVDLTVTRSSGSGSATFKLNLYGECYVLLNKDMHTQVHTYVKDSNVSTTDTVFGAPFLDKAIESVLIPADSVLPDEWNPEAFDKTDVVADSGTDIAFEYPSLPSLYPASVVLHYFGDGKLFIIPKS